VTGLRVQQAIEDLLDLRIKRYPHDVLLSRIWQLRHNFSAYDAAYITLAEELGAMLVTRDGRLASNSGHSASMNSSDVTSSRDTAAACRFLKT
jgi:predicted nucleic acid-binding protein